MNTKSGRYFSAYCKRLLIACSVRPLPSDKQRTSLTRGLRRRAFVMAVVCPSFPEEARLIQIVPFLSQGAPGREPKKKPSAHDSTPCVIDTKAHHPSSR